MAELVSELSALTGREYIAEIKSRLRDEERWAVLLDPLLIDHTRWGLERMIASIDSQKVRAIDRGTMEEKWLNTINALRRYAKERLDALPGETLLAMSSTKEARAWRSFSARLAMALEAADPEALDSVRTPYGGLTAREWLIARDQKG